MIITNNLTEDNLDFAINLGGLCMPSLGVINPENKILNNFGEITIIFKKDFFIHENDDGSFVKNNRDAHFYTHDAYSPRMPNIIYNYDYNKTKKQLISIIQQIEKETGCSSKVFKLNNGDDILQRISSKNSYDKDLANSLDLIVLELCLMLKKEQIDFVYNKPEDYLNSNKAFFDKIEEIPEIKDFFNKISTNNPLFFNSYYGKSNYLIENLTHIIGNQIHKNKDLEQTFLSSESLQHSKNLIKEYKVSLSDSDSDIENDFLKDFSKNLFSYNIEKKYGNIVNINFKKTEELWKEQISEAYNVLTNDEKNILKENKDENLVKITMGKKKVKVNKIITNCASVLSKQLFNKETCKMSLYNGETSSGKRKYIEYNLENVYKKMKKIIKEEGITSSESSSTLTLDCILYSELKSYKAFNGELKTQKDIENAIKKLTTSEKVKEFGENLITNLEKELIEKFPKFFDKPITYDGVNVLACYAFDLYGDYLMNSKNMNKFYEGYSENEIKEINNILRKYYLIMKNEQPSDYLELKYTNIIPFDDNLSQIVDKIIIPSNVNNKEKFIEYFNSLGIKTVIQQKTKNAEKDNDILKNLILSNKNKEINLKIDNKIHTFKNNEWDLFLN